MEIRTTADVGAQTAKAEKGPDGPFGPASRGPFPALAVCAWTSAGVSDRSAKSRGAGRLRHRPHQRLRDRRHLAVRQGQALQKLQQWPLAAIRDYSPMTVEEQPACFNETHLRGQVDRTEQPTRGCSRGLFLH